MPGPETLRRPNKLGPRLKLELPRFRGQSVKSFVFVECLPNDRRHFDGP